LHGYRCYAACVDVGTRDRERAGQEYGAVSLPAGERRLRAILQAAPRQETSAQQERLGRLGEEHDLQVKGDVFARTVKLSRQGNETKTKQFRNSFETVLSQFNFAVQTV